MNKKNIKLLEKLLNLCGEEGKYIVVSASELCDNSDNLEKEIEEILTAIKLFVEAEFITCKFYDTKNICFTKTPKGSLWLLNKTESEQSNKKHILLAVVVFAAGFLGAFGGTVLANLLF